MFRAGETVLDFEPRAKSVRLLGHINHLDRLNPGGPGCFAQNRHFMFKCLNLRDANGKCPTRRAVQVWIAELKKLGLIEVVYPGRGRRFMKVTVIGQKYLGFVDMSGCYPEIRHKAESDFEATGPAETEAEAEVSRPAAGVVEAEAEFGQTTRNRTRHCSPARYPLRDLEFAGGKHETRPQVSPQGSKNKAESGLIAQHSRMRGARRGQPDQKEERSMNTTQIQPTRNQQPRRPAHHAPDRHLPNGHRSQSQAGAADPLGRIVQNLERRIAPGSIRMIREAYLRTEGGMPIFSADLHEFLKTLLRAVHPGVRFEKEQGTAAS